ncbi:hypothetical protein [Solihabitans fulvus]|nr:hypothetical protein [Solihabitans fulvus]
MWAPLSVALLIGTVGTATRGDVGLAVAFGALFLVAFGYFGARRRFR